MHGYRTFDGGKLTAAGPQSVQDMPSVPTTRGTNWMSFPKKEGSPYVPQIL